MIRLITIFVWLLGFIVTGPVAAATHAAAVDSNAEVRIDNAWIRAVPPVSPAMAAYFSIANQTADALVLTGAKADFAGKTALHGRVPVDGDHGHGHGHGHGHMRHLSTVTVAAGESVSFHSGARHLMLMDLTSVPVAGSTVMLCLTFADHDDVCAPFPVRREAP